MKQLKGSNMRCNSMTHYPRSLTPPPNVQCEHTGHYYHNGKYFCKTHAAQWALALVLETDTRQLEADIFIVLHNQVPTAHSVNNTNSDSLICVGPYVLNITQLVRKIGLKGTLR